MLVIVTGSQKIKEKLSINSELFYEVIHKDTSLYFKILLTFTVL